MTSEALRNAICYIASAAQALITKFVAKSLDCNTRVALCLTHHLCLFKSGSAMQPRDLMTNMLNSYLSLLMRSKFILCPRGIGTSSWRLFETMKAGRVPVIISDQWVPPEGPSWLECSIRVPESEVMLIPEMLERREVDASKLALAARKVWDDWFSSEAVFHRIVEWCLAIQANRWLPTRLQAMSYHVYLLRPHFLRHWLMADIKRYLLSR